MWDIKTLARLNAWWEDQLARKRERRKRELKRGRPLTDAEFLSKRSRTRTLKTS